MNTPDDNAWRDLLAEPPRAPDTNFVTGTHRVIAVEALARLEGARAWRACGRDLLTAGSVVGGMVLSALFALHAGGNGSVLTLPLALGASLWALLHDGQMPAAKLSDVRDRSAPTPGTSAPPPPLRTYR